MNVYSTLQDIYDDLKQSAEQKWHSRLLKKNSIDAAIADYNVQLDDAARSFQVGVKLLAGYNVTTAHK